MARVDFRYKAVVLLLLLLVHCLLLLPLFAGVLCLSLGFCYATLCILFSVDGQGGELVAKFVFLMSSDYYFYVTHAAGSVPYFRGD